MATSAATWRRRFDGWLDQRSTPSKNVKGGLEHRAFCPMHENPQTSKTPSATINFELGLFHCHAECDKGLPLSQLWALYEDVITGETTPDNVTPITSARSARPAGRMPTEAEVSKWMQSLRRNEGALDRLRVARGLTDDTIDKFQLGYDGSRYTIPVRDEDGKLINVRKYAMGVTTGNKVISYRSGTGSNTLYGLDVLHEDEILLCEGEMDKLIARQYGFNSMTVTAGAGGWANQWTDRFEGKRVYIVYDNDKAGIQGARKVALILNSAGAKVHIVRLPVADKQDLTDFFVLQSYDAKDLRGLMDQTAIFEEKSVSRQLRHEPAVEVSLGQTTRADLVGKPMTVLGTVAGKQDEPFVFPRTAEMYCRMDWNIPKCKVCPMGSERGGGQKSVEVTADNKLLLRMVAKSEADRRKEFLKEFGIPPTCPDVEVHNLDHWTVEQLVVVPSIDDREATETNVRRGVFNVGRHDTPVNATVRFEGVNTDDPRSGVSVMQTWKCEETKTSIDNFKLTDQDLVDLSVFHPRGEQRASDKLWEIAEDLGANVTHIYGRPELHVAYDLVWHSLLDFRFRRANLGKGWLELLVMGDTRTGKSEAAQRLTKHYQAGVLTSCEGATLAGLVGGAQQINGSWVITWGTIPLHDRRLVVLDEVSGLKDKGVLEQMSEVRSSGRAKVTKIVSQETNARTRLIWISNPVDGRAIAEMPRGAIDAIQDLITTPEDVARFDMAMVAAKSDVKSSIINAARPPKVAHVYTSELCSRLVLWAWSRSARDVKWEMGAERLVLRLAELIGQRYIPDPPLLQAENARVKLARMSVAIAARLFSHDGTGQKVFVTKEHVRTARRFLDLLYRQPNFGYADHSLKEIRSRERAAAYRRDCWNYLRANEDVAEALKAVVNDKEFRTKDFIDLGGMQPELASHAVAQLLKMQMLRRHTRGYLRMQPELTELVRRLQDREYRRWETP